MKKMFLSIVGIVIYFFIAHLLIEWLVTSLYRYLGKKREANKLTGALGYIDRIVYAICSGLNIYPAFIGIWFGTKIVSRLVTSSHIEKEEDIKPEGERRNIYLIGNAVSLALGLLGGLLIRILFGLPLPDFGKIIRNIPSL